MAVVYEIHSDIDGHVTSYDAREHGDGRAKELAEQRAKEMDEEFPGQTHRVEEAQAIGPQ